ncbi:unnamed protein product [Menidia menidia]|uniref:(Atlantic silverside) hypothetical protein n=1 Tax=Menidia menidia TaxID=238744 RepID=A0A8S4BP15_9TELE|nr:unnamed protein product [Menidia menidia]
MNGEGEVELTEVKCPVHESREVELELLSDPAAGCTFEEDSDPNLCDFTQGEEDDFDWLLYRTYSSPFASSDLLKARGPAGPCSESIPFVLFLPSHAHSQVMGRFNNIIDALGARSGLQPSKLSWWTSLTQIGCVLKMGMKRRGDLLWERAAATICSEMQRPMPLWDPSSYFRGPAGETGCDSKDLQSRSCCTAALTDRLMMGMRMVAHALAYMMTRSTDLDPAPRGVATEGLHARAAQPPSYEMKTLKRISLAAFVRLLRRRR